MKLKTRICHAVFGCKWVYEYAPDDNGSMIKSTRSCPICLDMEYGTKTDYDGGMFWNKVTPEMANIVYKAMNPA